MELMTDGDQVSKMKMIYVAGSYTGEHPYQVHQNIINAWMLGVEVARLGAFPVIPHTNAMHMEGIQPYEFWAEGTMNMMRNCDAVLIIPGSETSKGTIAEIEDADARGHPVFYELIDLKEWLEEQNG